MLQDSLQNINAIQNTIDEDCRSIAEKALEIAVQDSYHSICDVIAKEVAEGKSIVEGQIIIKKNLPVASYYDVHYSNYGGSVGEKYLKIITETAKRYGLNIVFPLGADEPGFTVCYPLYHLDTRTEKDGDKKIETFIPHQNLSAFLKKINSLANAEGVQLQPMIEYITEYYGWSKYNQSPKKYLGNDKQYVNEILSQHTFVNHHSRYVYGLFEKRSADRTRLNLIIKYNFMSFV